jgi:succinyl-diaminopimelate desuccinylase
MPITLSCLNDYENAINVVPKLASAVIKIDPNYTSVEKVVSLITNLLNKEPESSASWKEEISSGTFEVVPLNEEEIKIISYGVQAHAAHPDLGINAISHLLMLLTDLFCEVNPNNSIPPILSFFAEKIGTDFSGLLSGIDSEDESGKLTLNVGNLSFDGKTISIGCNLRIPVTIDPITIHQKFKEMITAYPFMHTEETKIKDPLYVSPDSPLVQTLCQIYNETTGAKEKPIAIGGATYARAFPNCISFGANLPHQKDMCHQTDEFISIDNLVVASLIYAKAIYALGK